MKMQNAILYEVERRMKDKGIIATFDDSDVFYIWHAPNSDSELVMLSWDGGNEWLVCVYDCPDCWERDEASETYSVNPLAEHPVDVFARYLQ